MWQSMTCNFDTLLSANGFFLLNGFSHVTFSFRKSQFPDYSKYVRALMNVSALKIKEGRAEGELNVVSAFL